MNDEIIDRYIRLRYPDAHNNLADAFKNAADKVGWTKEKYEKSGDYFEATLLEHYQSFIKKGAPFTAQDVRQFKVDRRNKKFAGEKIPEKTQPILDTALRAFIKIDKLEGTTAEAINQALIDIADNFQQRPEKNVRKWIKIILPLSNIKQSPRGRPKT